KNRVQNWIKLEIQPVAQTTYKQVRRRSAQKPAAYQRIIKKHSQLLFQVIETALAQAKTMDGVFPLTTNTDLSPLEVLKTYKYQPFLEKRHSLLKTTLE